MLARFYSISTGAVNFRHADQRMIDVIGLEAAWVLALRGIRTCVQTLVSARLAPIYDGALIRAEITKWAKVVKAAGIQPD